MPSNIIVLAGAPIYPEEKLAGAAGILPGMLLMFGSGGTAGRLVVHGTASGNAVTMFALENKTPDRSVATVPIETPYSSGESMHWCIARPGDEIYALLPANAVAVIMGSNLTSNGDGTLKLFAAPATANDPNSIVAIAAEALDNSAVAARARIRVWVV
jgi:hypothetical protein